MKNKNVLKKFVIYNLTDLKALEEDFTDMASKGWYIRSVRSGIFEYEKKEPSRLRYCVEIVPTADRASNLINQKTGEYIELCEQSGWKLVCSSAEIFVFVTKNDKTPVITTDETEKLKLVQKSVTSVNERLWVAALIGMIADLIFSFKSFQISDLPFWIMIAVFWLGYLAMVIYKSVSFHKWYKNASENNSAGNRVEYNGNDIINNRKKLFYGYLAFVFVTVIIMAVWCIFNSHIGSAISILTILLLIAFIGVPLMIHNNKSNLLFGAYVHISESILMFIILIVVLPVITF